MEDTESILYKLGIVLFLIFAVATYSYKDFRQEMISLFYTLSLFTGKFVLGLSFIFLVSYIAVKVVRFYSDNLKTFIYKTYQLNSDLFKANQEFQSFKTETDKKLIAHLDRINDIEYELVRIIDRKNNRQQLESVSNTNKRDIVLALEQLIPNSQSSETSEEDY